jgi:hypothetical protein
MAITTQFILTCEYAFLSAGSNNLNLIGIFSQINADRFPFAYPRFAMVINFDATTSGQHVLRTVILDPSGKQIGQTDLPVAVTPGNMQVIAHFENMQFAIPGTYVIQISLDGILLGTRPVRITPVLTPGSQKTNLA